MNFVAGLTTVVLSAIALLHGLWALRIWWPIRDELALARAVAGFSGVKAMPPPLACAFVCIALSIIAAATATVVFGAQANGPKRLILWASAAVFAGRAFLGYTSFWKRLTPEAPFRRLDRTYYSPLCAFIAIGLLIALH